MAVRACALHAPADPAGLSSEPAPSRPSGLAPWPAGSPRQLNHSHRLQFSPTGSSHEQNVRSIWASQFPERCERFLLVEDDLARAGLGFSAKIWAAALLFAVREERVLLEVPRGEIRRRSLVPDLDEGHGVPNTPTEWEKLRNASVPTPRWCDRAPYTLQCFYAAWSHCTPPTERRYARPTGRPLKMSRWPHAAPVVIISLTRFHHLGGFWHSDPNAPVSEAMSFLFRPRPWVVAIGECVMREAALVPGAFTSVHVRDSVEKRKEARNIRGKLPSTPASELVAQMLTRAQPGATFLQTSSDRAAEAFEAFARRSGTPLAYTDNPRSDHDSWGGWSNDSSTTTLQTTVGAVNAYVAARAALASSPTDSLWTWFMTATAREFWAGRPAGFAAVSLGCAAPGSSAFRLTVMGSAAAVQRMQGALQGAPEAGLRCTCSRGCPFSRG